MIKLKLILSSVIYIILISSCAMGPNFTKPEPESLEAYSIPDSVRIDTITVDSLVNLNWWELFEDPVLDTLVRIALNENKNVNIAVSRLEEARATLGFTKADIYPRFDIQATATRGNLIGGALQSESTSNAFFIAPVVNWEIDFWGKFRRANEASRAELMASGYSLRTIQIGLISEVVSTYFLLLDYQRRLEISHHTLNSRTESLRIISQRFEKGIVPEIDYNQSQIQLEIAKASIPATERLIAITQHALSLLVGRLPGEIITKADWEKDIIPPSIPVGLPSQLLERRPDILQSEYALMAQNARIGVAEAMRFPAISLTGIFGAASTELSSLTTGESAWSISGSLLGPLFNFNKNTLRVEIEEERTKQALYSYENTVLNAFREVENALVEVRTFQQQLKSVKRKHKAAQNAAHLAAERYDKGVTSYLEYLDAERTFFSVELELSQVKQFYANSYVRLYKALGGGWLSEEEISAANNPDNE
jgi:outer membrane protein, multidrug efflux system